MNIINVYIDNKLHKFILYVDVVSISLKGLTQGSSNLSLEVQSAAEFSSNPDQTHLSVIF